MLFSKLGCIWLRVDEVEFFYFPYLNVFVLFSIIKTDREQKGNIMLTKSQKKTYDFIKGYITQLHISPTLQEISEGINIKSKGTVSRYVQSLVDLGLIAKLKEKTTSRNLTLTNTVPLDISYSNNLDNNFRYHISKDLNLKTVPSIPLIGTIAAGRPIEAIETSEEFNIYNILYGTDLYMLKVKGDSMIEEGISDGDFVICEPRNTADNGEIVVALIDNQEATLKRIYKHNNGTILLCPANSTMAPLEYEASRVKVQGILRCQLRSYC